MLSAFERHRMFSASACNRMCMHAVAPKPMLFIFCVFSPIKLAFTYLEV